jgi:hypothetical protein
MKARLVTTPTRETAPRLLGSHISSTGYSLVDLTVTVCHSKQAHEVTSFGRRQKVHNITYLVNEGYETTFATVDT